MPKSTPITISGNHSSTDMLSKIFAGTMYDSVGYFSHHFFLGNRLSRLMFYQLGFDFLPDILMSRRLLCGAMKTDRSLGLVAFLDAQFPRQSSSDGHALEPYLNLH